MPSLDSKLMSRDGWMDGGCMAGWSSSSGSRDGKKFVGKTLMVCIVGRYSYLSPGAPRECRI
jgi:hypothetical protein